jgi:putative transposase
LSRKQKGSKAQSRARKDVARVHKRVANVRNDWQWKQARFLVTVFDLLVFETLNIKAMHQIWGRKVSDLGFADFLLKTQWMATKLSKEMVKIDRWKPTRESATFAITDSKCPSICGHSCAALAGTWKIAT